MKNSLTPSIKFINHASVVLENENTKLLSDPWYFGNVFHEGWSLIYENDEEEILETLKTITHIWISHEHPDHLSIPFFKKNKDLLKNRNIKILFQETIDKRVINFVKSLNLEIIELKNKEKYKIGKNFSIKCIKFGFYDSALLANINEYKIYNLNDCPLNSTQNIKLFKKKFGSCDVLLTQFSYASWKGGKNNHTWRVKSAKEKTQTLINQATILEARTIIPFASFIKFSNIRNSYLNENRNTPDTLIDETKNTKINLVFLKPNEKQYLSNLKQEYETLNFWRNKILESNNQPLIDYKSKFSLDELNVSFLNYKKRIFKKNSLNFLKIIRLIPFIGAFKKIIIKIENFEKCIEVDIFAEKIRTVEFNYDIKLSADSFSYILNNSFGFDTLTVNGCFKQGKKNGFEKMTKLMAIENLNNLGIYFKPSIIFNFRVILIFLKLLNKVKNNLMNT